MDFITSFLAIEESKAINYLVVTDRLTKSVILVSIDLITADALAKVFLVHFYIYYSLLIAIISN
jgi:hypothetical protein